MLLGLHKGGVGEKNLACTAFVLYAQASIVFSGAGKQ
jgi:hypothetical protein